MNILFIEIIGDDINMNEEYIKDRPIIEKDEESQNIELMQSLIKAKMELEIANKNYEFAEAELIDYYAYQIKANQAKIDYLLKRIKKKGLMLDIVNETSLRLESRNEVG